MNEGEQAPIVMGDSDHDGNEIPTGLNIESDEPESPDWEQQEYEEMLGTRRCVLERA